MDTKRRRPERDRLSDLPDDIIGHVLSFLPSQEAARAAILSRRWRGAFANVHTISFQQAPSDHESSDDDSDGDDDVPRSPNRRLVDWINNALLIRRRCGGRDAQLRSLCVEMCRYDPRDSCSVHDWVTYALGHGVEELQLELRRRGDRSHICQSDNSSDSSDCESDYSDSSSGFYDSSESDSADSSSVSGYESSDDGANVGGDRAFPARLYACASLRALHLSSCWTLELPSTVHLPSLETLALSNISYASSGGDIQRLISGCPRLADLTLEACDRITNITMPPETRLRSFALRCCQRFRGITLDLSETREFEYRGRQPDASQFTLVGGAPTRIVSAKIHVCGRRIDLERLREFLLLFANAAHLQLGWPDKQSRSDYDDFFAQFPLFHNVTRLELASRCKHQGVVLTVAGILQQTPNLTVLSLNLGDDRNRVLLDDQDVAVDVPKVPVPCLGERLREVSVEQYEGANVQRKLLHWLLTGALVVESVRVVFAKGGYSVLDELTTEIKHWAANPAAIVSFL
ncbi:hypothetical protein CFC21_027731 [Triticum aestivum]|uniref:F-box domain-containing protein n=3 Tax=Triticum aestivum TaxID=4565 RepID=A0A9R1ENH0_WHEAT|nr:hypothetical protein CFC21_027727 [Triticum aestivum]KAF7013663.1 hypothetical protein CFC21_027731 [Triticum aestivum]